MLDITPIVERLARKTQQVFAQAQGAERHARLCQRLERLYGALELARWIEAHFEAVRRDIEAD